MQRAGAGNQLQTGRQSPGPRLHDPGDIRQRPASRLKHHRVSRTRGGVGQRRFRSDRRCLTLADGDGEVAGAGRALAVGSLHREREGTRRVRYPGNRPAREQVHVRRQTARQRTEGVRRRAATGAEQGVVENIHRTCRRADQLYLQRLRRGPGTDHNGERGKPGPLDLVGDLRHEAVAAFFVRRPADRAGRRIQR